MLVFLARRTVQMLLVMIGVSLLLFLLLEIDIDNLAIKVLGPYSLPEARELWLTENGYRDPLPVRYIRWLGGVMTGDFGMSVIYRVPVSDVLWPRLANTALLGGLVLALVIPLALFFGVLAGMREGALRDRVISVSCILTTSVPEYASAPLLTVIFVFWLDLLPGTSNMVGGFQWQAMVLPVMVLVLYDFGYVARMTRASMAEVMTTHYIRTAVLKGLPYRVVILKHALRNALIAPFTVIMLQLNWLLSGVIITEFFFSYKGFGALLLEASLNGDIFVIEACAIISVVVAVGSQLLSDLGYAALNPRIRIH